MDFRKGENEMREADFACVLLAGGQSSRMGGRKKPKLPFEAGTMEERVAGEMRKLHVPCLYSYRDEAGGIPSGFLGVPDDSPVSLGPAWGIMKALEMAEKNGLDGIFTAPCDMPYFRSVMARKAAELAGDSGRGAPDLVLYETRNGRRHYTCGYYSVSCLPALQKMMKEEDLRLRDLTRYVRAEYLRTADAGIPDYYLVNVNTAPLYERLLHRRPAPAAVAVCGFKNSGKTTLLEKIVRRMSRNEIRIAVIKHDGHDFEADVPGTDSFRMKAAGAYGTCVYSEAKFSLVKEQKVSVQDLAAHFPEADLILFEGEKDSACPKIETVRLKEAPETGRPPLAADPSTVLAYVTDRDAGEGTFPDGIPVFRNSDTGKVCELILREMDRAFFRSIA